ncbi:MAG TPA: restriction endonuclease subunit S [Lachnospiraceae bacterium]|jgi:type I restriction enzyme S subunit|nr:restriction endonuclease subunit S [Lachnospiraceae bacterium]
MHMNKKKEIVPKLRFPGFGTSEGWKKYKLRELADRITKKVGDNKLVTLSISAGIGFVSQAEKFSRDISGKQYCNYIYLKKGEFSYNKGNSKTFPQGCIYELKEYDEAAVPNAFISFRFKENLVPSFYQGYFDCNFHGKQLVRFITSGARSDGLLNISPTDFFSIVLPTPVKKEEQQKIADCLSSIDDLIDAESRKLKALEKYKKGLMQKLFPAEGKTLPEWRFPEFQGCGEWKYEEIGNIGEVITGKTPSTSDATLWDGDIQFVTPTDITENKYQCRTQRTVVKTPKMKVLPKHTIMFTCIASIGKMALSLYPCITNQQINSIVPKSCYNNEFIYYSLLQKTFLIKAGFANSTLPIINKTDFSKIQVPVILDKKEQQKIADCLSEVDTMIEEQSNKVEQLKAHKKGLMQGLFPSLEEADV